MQNLPASVLVKNQTKTLEKMIPYHGRTAKLIVTVRYDDQCGNGHNTFSVTGEVWLPGKRDCDTAGMIHEIIGKQYGKTLGPVLKWNGTTSDGPLYYLENTLYHIKQGKIDYARSTAVWPDATLEDFTKEKLLARLPGLMVEFKAAIEGLGFIY